MVDVYAVLRQQQLHDLNVAFSCSNRKGEHLMLLFWIVGPAHIAFYGWICAVHPRSGQGIPRCAVAEETDTERQKGGRGKSGGEETLANAWSRG